MRCILFFNQGITKECTVRRKAHANHCKSVSAPMLV
jgi:hypothetical protein